MLMPCRDLKIRIACEFAMAIMGVECWDDDWIYPDDFEAPTTDMSMQRAERVMALLEGRPMPPATYLPPPE